MKSNTFSLKKYTLRVFYRWLDTPLHSKEAVARNEIAAIINDAFISYEQERMALIREHGARDAQNELIINKESGNYEMVDDTAFEIAFELLRNQEVSFEITPANRPQWKIVASIIERTNKTMDVETTEFYVETLQALKSI